MIPTSWHCPLRPENGRFCLPKLNVVTGHRQGAETMFATAASIALRKSAAMAGSCSWYRRIVSRNSSEALGCRKNRSGAKDDVVEFLAELGPRFELHRT